MIVLTTVVVLLFSSYMALRTKGVQTYITGIITRQLSEQLNAEISVKGVDVAFFNKIILEEILIKDQDGDSLLQVHELVASIDSFSVKRKEIYLERLGIVNTKINVRINADGITNYSFLTDSLDFKTDSTSKLKVNCSDFLFKNAQFAYENKFLKRKKDISLYNINLKLSELKFSDDEIGFQIDNCEMTDNKGFTLKEFNADLSIKDNDINIRNLSAKTNNSTIKELSFYADKSKFKSVEDFDRIKLDLNLNEINLGLKDLAQMVPALRGMDDEINVSGHIYGTLVDLKGKNIQFHYGNNTRLTCDFYLNGLPRIDDTYMHVELKKSLADFNEIEKINLPAKAKLANLNFPDFLKNAGVLEYEGSFTGFVSDFVAYGTFISNYGTITTDLSVKPFEKSLIAVDGHLNTIDFKLGDLLNNKSVGEFTYNGQIDGTFNKDIRSFDALIDGGIDKIQLNEYELKNIQLKGEISDRKFDGQMNVEDENLAFDFNGVFDLNELIPVFDFDLNMNKANLLAFNLDPVNRISELSFFMKAKFMGNTIDNISGNIWIEDGRYWNQNGELALNSFELKTYNDSLDVLELNSDYLDVKLMGNYQLASLKNSVFKVVSHYLPSGKFFFEEQNSDNDFSFEAQLKEFSRLTEILLPQIYVEPSYIAGEINTQENKLNFNVDIPRMEYGKTIFNNIEMSFRTDDHLNIKNRIGEVELDENHSVYNLAFYCDGFKNVLDTRLSWNNFHQSTYSGAIGLRTKFKNTESENRYFETRVLPTKVYIADSLWRINSAKIIVDSTEIRFDKLRINHKNQEVFVNGALSESKDKRLNIRFKDIDLANVNNLISSNLNIKGILNGEAAIYDVFDNSYFLSDLKIDKLGMRDRLFGDATMVNKWDAISEEINSEFILSREDKNTLLARGSYVPESSDIDFNFEVDGLATTILDAVMPPTFVDFRGDASGNVRIHGKPSNLLLDGSLYGNNAGVTLAYLQTHYSFSDSVKFAGDSLIFDHIDIHDMDNNHGIFNGSIKHVNFRHMMYDLSLTSPYIMVLNTNSSDNEQFYGKAYAEANMKVTGIGQDILIEATGKSERGTEVNISLDYERRAEAYDFLTFKSHKPAFIIEEKKRITKVDKSNINMSFDIEVTPDARVQLIYNSQIGDVIRSNGYGNLQIGIDNDFNIVMFGDYNVVSGDYLFTLQNVINKKFDIESGGAIIWNGDPYDATIDVNAVYKLKASLYELFPNSQSGIDYTQRIPVDCKIALTDDLNNPEIGFDIDFPNSEERLNDEVQQFFNTEEDMNRQILSLLILGKFYTPEYMRGSYEATNSNVVGTTASELFSNQLSNWLSKISNDFDIGVNYRPGNQISDDEIELALSTQMFNDRVTLNGNIGNNVAQNTSTNSDIVGDFDLNVKLNRSGKLQFKAFNHANNNLIYETSPYTQGIGLTYREDYDNFGELWQKIKKMLVRNKKD